MIDKVFYTWNDIEKACVNITTQMYKDDWRPDYIVGITRGGNIPATIISNLTDIPCHALKVSLRDSVTENESNLWMAEDAYGYEKNASNILIVDDINDSGATFDWIIDDWKRSCLPHANQWDCVWGKNVRFAVITENFASDFNNVSYYAKEINKSIDTQWIVYPWENVAGTD